MARITNEVLAERIDNVHKEIIGMKVDVKENTKFRNQAKGALSILAFGCTALGGFIVWIFNKIFGGK